MPYFLGVVSFAAFFALTCAINCLAEPAAKVLFNVLCLGILVTAAAILDDCINISSESLELQFLLMFVFMHTYTKILTICMSSTISLTLNLNLGIPKSGSGPP